MQSQRIPTSVGMETVDETVARAKKLIQPTVSANELVNPPAKVTPPVPQINTNTGARTAGLIDTTATNTEDFLGAELESRNKANEINALLGTQTFDGAGERANLTEQFGVTADTKRLKDIQTQLAKRNVQTELQKAQATEGGAGAIQSQRALNLADKQAAIRDAGLAAEANILQGNIETASTLINNAMSDYYQDRQLDNQNKIQQLEYFSGIADDQTAQLLNKEQRVYEADIAKIERVQNAVDTAVTSGVTTPSEIAMLTNPNTTDNERLALAQLIQARGAKQTMDMDLTLKAAQLAKLREPIISTRETSILEIGGTKQLVDTQTGEVIATFGADVTSDEISNAKDISFVNTLDSLKDHAGMAKAVGTSGLARWTPFKIDTMSGQVSDFVGSIENVVKTLTLNTFEEAKAKGMTFGAMSQGEWDILGQTSTKIINWKRERDDGSIYYETSESNMKKELDTLSNFSKMDALRKGIEPEQLGVIKQDDGTFWTKNSDGTFTQLDVIQK